MWEKAGLGANIKAVTQGTESEFPPDSRSMLIRRPLPQSY